MKDQILFVAVRPDGSVCGPVGKDSGFVMDALCVGYLRANKSNESFDEVWPKIEKVGYSVKKCRIVLIDDLAQPENSLVGAIQEEQVKTGEQVVCDNLKKLGL